MSQAIPPRPPLYTPEHKGAAVDGILTEVANLIGKRPEDIRDDLIRAYDCDGYQFAKNLERLGYDPDALIVEALDGTYFLLMRAHEETVRAWVSVHSIPTPFSIGEEVSTKWGIARVVAIRPDTAQLIVQPAISDGTHYGEEGGIVCPAEEVQRTHEGAAA